MKKKFANHYIDRKYKFVYNRGDSYWQKIVLDNNCLFSDRKNGDYRTKVKPEDLPENYLHYWDGLRSNYIRTEGVVDIFYQPVLENHLFKDDSLYISYKEKIKILKEEKHISTWYTLDDKTYDSVIYGTDIVNFLVYINKYSNYDIEPIKDQIWNEKMLWLKDNETEMFNDYVKNRENFESWFTKESL